jgi:hypothetical protein
MPLYGKKSLQKVSLLPQSGRLQVIPSKGVSENICGSNPNIETRNPKWFDRLTILSDVEGQIIML